MDEYRRTLLIGPAEIKDTTLVSSNLEDSYLNYTIYTGQEIYLGELIGDAMYRRLQEITYNTVQGLPDGIDDNPDYADLLDECVKPYLAARITMDVLWNISVKIRNAGAVKTSDTNVIPVTLEEIKEISNQVRTYKDSASQKLASYLRANYARYPELNAETSPLWYRKPMIDFDFGNTGGLWLGRPSHKDKCGC